MKARRPGQITAILREQVLAQVKDGRTDRAILDEVHRRVPTAQTSLVNVRAMRTRMRGEGHDIPSRA